MQVMFRVCKVLLLLSRIVRYFGIYRFIDFTVYPDIGIVYMYLDICIVYMYLDTGIIYI